MKELTLYRLCLSKVARLLKSSFWKEAFVFRLSRSNPSIIDDLITCVLQLTGWDSLSVDDLYPLLISGRVEHFKLENIKISRENFIAIFMSLSVACLRSLTLRNIRFSRNNSSLRNTTGVTVKAAVELSLGLSYQLETIESCVEFDLKCIRNCKKLRVLKLNFIAKSPLCGFLEASDGSFVTHNNLRVFEVCDDLKYATPPAEIANIIKYCPALVEMNTNISRSLELLHEAELLDGTLFARYQLRKCCLSYVFSPDKSATLTAVRIATMTCPLIEHIDILLNNNEVVHALSDFPKLTSLLIEWESDEPGDFQLGFQMLLDKIGANLKKLQLINICNVDFAALATKCPIMEELSFEFLNEFQGYDMPSEGFRCLKSLSMDSMEIEYGCSEKTLFLLISNATNLQKLHLHSADYLNDTLLVKIFRKNSLSHIKEAVIVESSLSEEGVRNLVKNMKTLESLHLSSSQVSLEKSKVIVHSINPNIIFSDIDFSDIE